MTDKRAERRNFLLETAEKVRNEGSTYGAITTLRHCLAIPATSDYIKDLADCIEEIANRDALCNKMPKPVKVMFNGPATIVFFDDGTKSVAKCRQCNTRCNEYNNSIGGKLIKSFMCGIGGYSRYSGVMIAMAKRAFDFKVSDIIKLIKESE